MEEEKFEIPEIVESFLFLAIQQRIEKLKITPNDLSEKTGIPLAELEKLFIAKSGLTKETIQLIGKAIGRYEVNLEDKIYENFLSPNNSPSREVRSSTSVDMSVFKNDEEIFILIINRLSFFNSSKYSDELTDKALQGIRERSLKDYEARKAQN